MTGATLVRDAVASTFRNRSRTLLTVLAIVIGAFTITLTSAVSAGGGAFITSTVRRDGQPRHAQRDERLGRGGWAARL